MGIVRRFLISVRARLFREVTSGFRRILHRNMNVKKFDIVAFGWCLTYLLNPLGPFRSIGRQPCFSTSLSSGLEVWPLAM